MSDFANKFEKIITSANASKAALFRDYCNIFFGKDAIDKFDDKAVDEIYSAVAGNQAAWDYITFWKRKIDESDEQPPELLPKNSKYNELKPLDLDQASIDMLSDNIDKTRDLYYSTLDEIPNTFLGSVVKFSVRACMYIFHLFITIYNKFPAISYKTKEE